MSIETGCVAKYRCWEYCHRMHCRLQHAIGCTVNFNTSPGINVPLTLTLYGGDQGMATATSITPLPLDYFCLVSRSISFSSFVYVYNGLITDSASTIVVCILTTSGNHRRSGPHSNLWSQIQTFETPIVVCKTRKHIVHDGISILPTCLQENGRTLKQPL